MGFNVFDMMASWGWTCLCIGIAGSLYLLISERSELKRKIQTGTREEKREARRKLFVLWLSLLATSIGAVGSQWASGVVDDKIKALDPLEKAPSEVQISAKFRFFMHKDFFTNTPPRLELRRPGPWQKDPVLEFPRADLIPEYERETGAFTIHFRPRTPPNGKAKTVSEFITKLDCAEIYFPGIGTNESLNAMGSIALLIGDVPIKQLDVPEQNIIYNKMLSCLPSDPACLPVRHGWLDTNGNRVSNFSQYTNELFMRTNGHPRPP